VRAANKGVIVVLVALAVGGCEDREGVAAPREVAGPVRDAAATVERLEHAVRTRDFAAICRDLLTARARERTGGSRCAATMRGNLGSVTNPRLRVVSVSVAGRRATATLRTSAAGQPPTQERLELEQVAGRYRIAALGR
jgi:hypothetical protein